MFLYLKGYLAGSINKATLLAAELSWVERNKKWFGGDKAIYPSKIAMAYLEDVGITKLKLDETTATIKQLMWLKPMTRLGSLPAHCQRGRARKLLLESMAPQCQLRHESRFGVLEGHFPPSMIGVWR
jgi:hypothetical protein